jgi:DNA-binding IclR family transcriptional regulator
MVTAVDRAARVLWAFAESWDFLTLPEIARRARLSKPTTFRILATLAAEGLVLQNEANSTYGLGFLTLRLADIVLGAINLREPARSQMKIIRDTVNETVVLSILSGDGCCDVDSVEGSNMIAQSHSLGVTTALHASVPGRAMLAAGSDAAVAANIRRVLRGASRTSREKLSREIAQIRSRGYAVSSGEFMRGGHTIAVAITNGSGDAVAALHISFPQARYTSDLEAGCVKALTAGAAAISKACGSCERSPG